LSGGPGKKEAARKQGEVAPPPGGEATAAEGDKSEEGKVAPWDLYVRLV
jgi:hypothetical protein